MTGVFTGQIAVVTGASSGIGRAIAIGLAQEGAALCLVGRRIEALESTAEAAQAGDLAGVRSLVRCFQVDLARDDDIRQLVESLRSTSPPDLLVHSAAFYARGRLEFAPVTELDQQYRVNLRAPYLLTQFLLPGLRERHGQIVFVNSSVGLRARAEVSQYSSTKHALKALADSLREEVNSEGVRVLTIYPGRTASPLQAKVHALEGRPYRPETLMQPEDVASVVLTALRLPRTAEVTDIQVRAMAKLP